MSCGGNFTKPSRNATHSSSKWQIHAIHSNSEIHNHVPYVYFIMKISCIYYSLEIIYFWIDILKMFSCTIFVNKAFTT